MTTLLPSFKRDVVTPVLTAMRLSGDLTARINLHTGIPAVESGFVAKRQIGGGPALGYCMVEPATHDDIWRNYLAFRPGLTAIGLGYLPGRFGGVAIGSAEAMVESDAYAVFVSAVAFLRSPVALPGAKDAAALCGAWKAGYNTALGKGAVTPWRIALFQQAIDA